ncbi:MAG: C4-type zinc ribbon domain-containing protein [Rikenellaceae bacterium]
MMAQKKANEVDYSIQEKIIALYELQKIDSQIDEINKIKGELPLEVTDLEDRLVGVNTRLDSIEAEITQFETLTLQRRREIDESNMLITKYKEQHGEVRNNREWDSINKEIEYQELEIELSEKRLREYKVSIDQKSVQLEATRVTVTDVEAELDSKRTELSSIEAATEDQIKELNAKGEEQKLRIDERLLAAYTRIRGNVRNGLAVVTLCRNACGGCFNRIPPQRQVEIKQGKKIIACEYCGRILVHDPEMEAEA